MLTESFCLSAAHRKDKFVMERNNLVTEKDRVSRRSGRLRFRIPGSLRRLRNLAS